MADAMTRVKILIECVNTMDNLFGIHETALRLRASRAELIAANIANVDTPGFKARDIDFNQVLRTTNNNSDIRLTNIRHLDSGGKSQNDLQQGDVAIQYRSPMQPSLDGNTVDLQTERAAFMENSMMYQASLRFLNGSINTLKTAIRGEL